MSNLAACDARVSVNKPTFVTVVSGPPRSGTSMMMHMLQSGGVPIASDGMRQPDESSPGGYFELERVKSLQHPGPHPWIRELHGKAVKIPYVLLYRLPAGCPCRIIFMGRHWGEIHASQQVMLKRNNVTTTPSHDKALVPALRDGIAQVKEWLAAQPEKAMLSLDYNELIRDAHPHCQKINLFLGGALDVDRMAAVVDASLYRQRQTGLVEEPTVGDERIVWQRLKDLGYL